MPHISTNFADDLDPTLQVMWNSGYPTRPSMIPMIFNDEPNNGRNIMEFSQNGALPDWQLFEGETIEAEIAQGYKTTMTALEFAQGMSVQRKLEDDQQYSTFMTRPKQMRESEWRTREKYGARIFNMGFSDDSFFYENAEGVALFSTAHTTRASNVSTAIGFSNKTTGALSSVSVNTMYVLAREFRGDIGNIIDCRPDTLLIPDNLHERAMEIENSQLNPKDANNAENVWKGTKVWEWQYLRDNSTTNFFYLDSTMIKTFLHWWDRIPAEFRSAREFNTMVALFAGYARYANCWTDWRFGVGAEVS